MTSELKPEQKSELKLGNVVISSLSAESSTPRRFSGLIWGQAGCGKTTLAATAPGRKLIINFDPDGATSLSNAPTGEIILADMANERETIVPQFDRPDPFGLSKIIEEGEFDTVIVDSLTSVSELCLQYAITSQPKASIENPGMKGYGIRNAYTLRFVKNILRVTGKAGKHVIFIAHEATPDKSDDGVVLQITIMLGGQLPQLGPLQISEVWALTDTGKERRIAVRPARQRRPMKTRMFHTTGDSEFVWDFNPDTWEGPGRIEEWLKQWQENGGRKIPLPMAKSVKTPPAQSATPVKK